MYVCPKKALFWEVVAARGVKISCFLPGINLGLKTVKNMFSKVPTEKW
jgi:hypothetical protein